MDFVMSKDTKRDDEKTGWPRISHKNTVIIAAVHINEQTIQSLINPRFEFILPSFHAGFGLHCLTGIRNMEQPGGVVKRWNGRSPRTRHESSVVPGAPAFQHSSTSYAPAMASRTLTFLNIRDAPKPYDSLRSNSYFSLPGDPIIWIDPLAELRFNSGIPNRTIGGGYGPADLL